MSPALLAIASILINKDTADARRLAILEKVFSRCEEEGECLIWKGPNSGNGRGGYYGRFSFEGKTASVHRTVWATIFGPIPPRKQIDHKCNNRRCCNPSHLTLITHKRNQILRDERARNAKVTE